MDAVFLKLLNMSVTAGYVILAILLVRLLLRKAPKKYSYLLWSAAAFRLCCPVSFSSAFSLFRLKLFAMTSARQTGSAALQYIPEPFGLMAQPEVTVGTPAASTAINNTLPAAEYVASVDPLQALILIASCVWIIGVFVLLMWAMVSYMRLRFKMDTAVLLEDNVYQSDQVRSPFILGFIHPKIYIPFGLDEGALRYILAHERCHLKRLDHLIKPFAFLLLAVHWFNPLCWLAFYLMGKDMEMSCDEKVLSGEASVCADYSTVLLSFAANRRFPSPSPLAFGESGVRSRIKNALKWKRPRVWVTLLAAVLCAAVVAACAANPAQENTPQEDGGSPYQWTSSVQASDVDLCQFVSVSSLQGSYYTPTGSQLSQLISILNEVPAESIYTGRGIPGQFRAILRCGDREYTLLYGGDVIEISFDSETASQYDEGVWEIHDEALNAFMAALMAPAPQVQWEYTPLLSSRYPAFPFHFDFDFPYTHVEAQCRNGTLIGYDDYDGSSYPQGQTLTVPPGSSLYWSPSMDREDLSRVPADTIAFTVYNGEEAIYSGWLEITTIYYYTDPTAAEATFAATLTNCPALFLYQGDSEGGTLTTGIANIQTPAGFEKADLKSVHNLTESGPVTLSAAELPLQRLYTGNGNLLIDFSLNEGPVHLQLYGTHSAGPLNAFSSSSKDLKSCSFTGLEPGYYYLAAQCSSGTQFTISEH